MLGERDNHYTTKPRTMRHLICTACSHCQAACSVWYNSMFVAYLCGSELWSRCEDIVCTECVYADIVIFKDINKSVLGQ